MYLKQRKMCKILTVISILLIFMPISTIYANVDLNKDIKKFTNKENLEISSFKELYEEYKGKGYDLNIIDIQNGYTMPKLMKDKEILKLKETASSVEDINDSLYPYIFENYEVKFLKSKKGKDFVFFLKSDLVNIIIPTKGKNIEASVNGNNLVNISNGEEINLPKEGIYTIDVYKDGTKILSEEVDLSNYTSNEYTIKGKGSIAPIILGFISIAIIGGGYLYKKNTTPRDKSKVVDIKDNTNSNKGRKKPIKVEDMIIVQGKIESVETLVSKNEYESVLNTEVIEKLKDHIDSTDSRLKVVQNNNQNILKNGISSDVNNKIEISSILDESQEISDELKKVQKDVHELELLIRDIREDNKDRKISSIKNIVKKSKNIFIKLESCYLKLDDIKSRQHYIEAYDNSLKQIPSNSVYTKKSYEDIVDNNTKVISNLVEFVIKRDSEMSDFTQFITEEMKSISASVENVYSDMKGEVERISNSVSENSLSMNLAMKELDTNVIKVLNKKISDISKEINDVELKNKRGNSNHINTKLMNETLKKDIENAINTKLDVIETMIPSIITNTNKQGENIDTIPNVKKYNAILEEDSFAYLRTAEYLYLDQIKNSKVKLDDYSNIYIMYSKLLESELYKCLNDSNKSKYKYMSLGKIIGLLISQDKSSWQGFSNLVKERNIQSLRNHAAHNGDGAITVSHVNNIRDFLLDDSSEINKGCWLDFIIEKRKNIYRGTL